MSKNVTTFALCTFGETTDRTTAMQPTFEGCSAVVCRKLPSMRALPAQIETGKYLQVAAHSAITPHLPHHTANRQRAWRNRLRRALSFIAADTAQQHAILRIFNRLQILMHRLTLCADSMMRL